MAEKNTDDDNNCCHDNFDQNFGNFEDNYDNNTHTLSGNARIETFIFP